MPSVTMWWAQTNWSFNAPGITITPRPSGYVISGTTSGQTSGFFTMYERSFSISLVSNFWLAPNRIPATGCDWQSDATDMTQGTIIGSTQGGIYPFGPWPTTSSYLIKRHRVFSGTKLIEEGVTPRALLSILETEWATVQVSLPLFGVFTRFSDATFDFDRSQPVGIELGLDFRLFFRGDGALTFNAVPVSLPQFDLVSTR